MQIDPIEQRTGNALAITLPFDRTTTAFEFEVAEITARAGIHCGDEHDFARESDAAGSARDGDAPILESLPPYCQRRTPQFRPPIEKPHAIVGLAHRAW